MKFNIFIVLIICFLLSCKSNVGDKTNLLFESLKPENTGIDFENKLVETNDWNIIQYLYFYNGGGVATGDINNDGLTDVYFTSNQGSNKLYLNKGNLKFEDITDKAGVADLGAQGSLTWKTGVTMADVNADGWLDIYVSHVSNYKGLTGHNKLFINNKNGTFSEVSEKYGLNATGLCTQAVFFDYDGDGDLDCYILRHSIHPTRNYRPIGERDTRDELSSDLLLKNYGGRFDDITKQTGIKDGSLGYGLGISVADLNNDGAPDIYVGNDFHDNDYLFYNNGKGNFTEGVTKSLGHTAAFSMGNDIADFNNDGLLDIIGLDMKPEEEPILKSSAITEGYNIFDFKNKDNGYLIQYPRNMLQMNVGMSSGNQGFNYANFSEIGQFSGVSATDWSWAGLFADFDNDGWKDLYITNGIMRRPNDLDYIKYISNENIQNSASDLQLIQQMPDGQAANYAFKNKGNLTFENASDTWGLNQYGLSNGAAYADFDNDGDLDLVVNNINSKAFVLKNKSESFFNNKYLKVKLVGKGGNTEGVGAKVIAYTKDTMQIIENQPVRGFLSSVEPVLNFGFYNAPSQGRGIDYLDSLRVIWRDGSTQLLKIVSVNQVLTLKQKDAVEKWNFNNKYLNVKNNSLKSIQNLVFQNITNELEVKYKHHENTFYDSDKEKLIPHFLSTEGPKLAVGDVNSDGLEDFYVGGAKGYAGQLFIKQKKDGYAVSKQSAFEKDMLCEDVGADFFDADGDKDLDLYVVSGGNELEEGYETAKDRLYINDGKGNFSKKTDALPKFYHNGSCVKPHDFDGDGDVDLFVGSRSDMRDYGVSPHSFLLKNDGKGNFLEAEKQITNGMDSVGMVIDAAWLDMNRDGIKDLVIVGEWMPITIFYYTGDDFLKSEIENTSGMWRCLETADVDNDGDLDLLIGNIGLNSNWKATRSRPMRLYVKDFDNNGDREPIISYYRQGIEWPFASKDELVAQIPSLRKRFPEYLTFARSPFSDVFNNDMLKGAIIKEIQLFESVCLLNKGGELEMKALPTEAQLSTLESYFIEDFDGDGNKDLLIGGNFYEMLPSIGRFDASTGLVLKGDGKGNFAAQNTTRLGIQLRGGVRDIAKAGNHIIVGINNAPIQIFELKKIDKSKPLN